MTGKLGFLIIIETPMLVFTVYNIVLMDTTHCWKLFADQSFYKIVGAFYIHFYKRQPLQNWHESNWNITLCVTLVSQCSIWNWLRLVVWVAICMSLRSHKHVQSYQRRHVKLPLSLLRLLSCWVWISLKELKFVK